MAEIIKDIKLVSGEEIITAIVENGIERVVITNPLLFSMTYKDGDRSQGDVSFSPWMIGRKNSHVIDISKDHIIAITDPSDEAISAYKRIFEK